MKDLFFFENYIKEISKNFNFSNNDLLKLIKIYKKFIKINKKNKIIFLGMYAYGKSRIGRSH